jgi:PKD domain
MGHTRAIIIARRCLLAVAFWALATLITAGPAAACTIDGVASMKLDNLYALKNKALPASGTLATWAQFTLGDASPHKILNFAEDMAKLKKVLPAASLQHPFSWKFGDGASAVGQQVSHSYARAGLYKVETRYYLPSTKQWVLFDSAQLRIVPPIVVTLVPQHTSSASSGTNMAVVALAGLAVLACLGVIAVQVRGMRQGDGTA